MESPRWDPGAAKGWAAPGWRLGAVGPLELPSCDEAQPNDITMSSIPTNATSSRTSKVNSILSTNPNTSSLDGILPKRLPLYIARYHTTSTDTKGDAEGARESKPSKAYAWKRRRKKSLRLQGAVLATARPALPCHFRPPAGVRLCKRSGTTAWPVLPPHRRYYRSTRACEPSQGIFPCAGLQAGHTPETAGLGRLPGRHPSRGNRPPARPRPAPRPASRVLHPLLY